MAQTAPWITKLAPLQQGSGKDRNMLQGQKPQSYHRSYETKAVIDCLMI
jgi:hypothetical protein